MHEPMCGDKSLIIGSSSFRVQFPLKPGQKLGNPLACPRSTAKTWHCCKTASYRYHPPPLRLSHPLCQSLWHRRQRYSVPVTHLDQGRNPSQHSSPWYLGAPHDLRRQTVSNRSLIAGSNSSRLGRSVNGDGRPGCPIRLLVVPYPISRKQCAIGAQLGWH